MSLPDDSNSQPADPSKLVREIAARLERGDEPQLRIPRWKYACMIVACCVLFFLWSVIAGTSTIPRGKRETAGRHFQTARQDLETAIGKLEGDRGKTAKAKFILALVLHALKDADQATRVLSDADDLFGQLVSKGSGNANIYFARVVRDEAFAKILGPPYQKLLDAEKDIAAGRTQPAIEAIAAALQLAPDAGPVISKARKLVTENMLGHTALSPTSERKLIEWQYRFSKPKDGWDKALDQQSGWNRAPALFGSYAKSHYNTLWAKSQPEIWIRREFEVKDVPKRPLLVRGYVDDRARISINGVVVIERNKWTNWGYSQLVVLPDASTVLKPGRNVLAVHCVNEQGDTGIDVGLYLAGERDVWTDVLTKAIQKAPDSHLLIRERAHQNIRNDRYLEAGRDFIRFTPLEKDQSLHWLNAASLLAFSGDRNAYRRYCESLIEQHAKTDSPTDIGRLIKACLLLPGVIDPKRLPINRYTAALDAEKNQIHWPMWANAGVGLSAFRSGDLGEASRRLEAAAELIPKRDAIAHAMVKPLQAMTIIRRQNDPHWKSKARRLLEETKRILDQPLSRHNDETIAGLSLLTMSGNLKHNAIIGELLRREAERMLTAKSHDRPRGMKDD